VRRQVGEADRLQFVQQVGILYNFLIGRFAAVARRRGNLGECSGFIRQFVGTSQSGKDYPLSFGIAEGGHLGGEKVVRGGGWTKG